MAFAVCVLLLLLSLKGLLKVKCFAVWTMKCIDKHFIFCSVLWTWFTLHLSQRTTPHLCIWGATSARRASLTSCRPKSTTPLCTVWRGTRRGSRASALWSSWIKLSSTQVCDWFRFCVHFFVVFSALLVVWCILKIELLAYFWDCWFSCLLASDANHYFSSFE